MDEQYKFKKETLDLSKLVKCKDYVFDYEINNIKFEEEKSSDSNITLNSKMYYYDKDHHADRIVNYNNFKDCKFREPFKIPKNAYSASFLKHLVSKKKRRYQDSEFDLDMAYITDRVIAMGYPSVGLEAIYRNDVNDVIAFFEKKHKGNVKIYNLCLEKDRIYEKKLFLRSKVALFPSLDHNPCSVKLLLEFCVDICLFLILNLDSVAAVHCKAGKGRTGVMICCYLVFSGLCKNTDDAINYYGVMRTTNMKGVTIPSQKRYIKYFETFLKANFYAPYIYLIPKIIKEHLFLDGKPPVIKNLLINLKEDERYYTSPDKFRVNWIKIGPLPKEIFPTITIENFTHRVFKYPDMICSFKYEDNLNYNINVNIISIHFLYFLKDKKIKRRKKLMRN
jgi:phosphatidylinositol-3,4,5-trisphosphate 3-phosphatase/dual-specificity protein phosphatase PTEN